MVFHLGDENRIARLQQVAAKAVGHQVDAFGGALDEHHLFRRDGVDKARRLFPHRFHLLSRLSAQGVNAAMHRGIAVAIEIQLAVDHHLRFLRAGGAVEIGQRLAVHLTRQQREIAAHAFNRITHAASPGRRWAMRASTRSRMMSLAMPSVSSAAKAKMIICCAACLSIPRDCR